MNIFSEGQHEADTREKTSLNVATFATFISVWFLRVLLVIVNIDELYGRRKKKKTFICVLEDPVISSGV